MRRFLRYWKDKKERKLMREIKGENIKNEKKKAILIGLNYPGSHYQLRGCINDVKNGAIYLSDHGYDAKVLVDKDISAKYNLLEALAELMDNNSPSVFFHYSGHGTQTADLDGDEEDHLDEVVYSKDGVMITDDQINDALKLFPENKVVFLVFDCCHSSSIVDLPYTLTETGIKTNKINKKLKAKVICISACQDPQTAADVNDRGTAYGALSATLYSLLRTYQYQDLTWKQLYIHLLFEMRKKKYVQLPSISASDPSLFDQHIDF